MAEKTTDIAPRERQTVTRREPNWARPFRMLDRLADEVESAFDDFGLVAPRFGRRWLANPWRAHNAIWAPDIEVSQRDNELIVRADLPGMKKEDVSINLTDDEITISGERRFEEETERGGIYRSERSYGSFARTIPLPEGTITDQAKATFSNGVLEIRLPAPNQATRGRRLEIAETSDTKK